MAPTFAPFFFFFALIAHVLFAAAAKPLIGPSVEQARKNAVPIFNSIHSATRQWGSSLDHNGLAMIPAKVPKGVLLYHGTHNGDVNTTGLEWLAFEPEHSEIFSLSWRAAQATLKAHQARSGVSEQSVLHDVDKLRPQSGPPEAISSPAVRGYLRTYQANRDLNLLYLDGMSSGKGCLGPMDTQDLVLRLINGTSPCDTRVADVIGNDVLRVGELCDILGPLGYDGLLRMESGFEIVYCEFSDGGLHLSSQMRRPFWDQMKAWHTPARLVFHEVRAAVQNYHGMFGGLQVQLDFSRMVSAYFYPINITGSNDKARGRPLPRLSSTTQHERQSIRRRVQEVAVRRDRPGIAWQLVVDAIVSRYADRLALLSSLSPAQLRDDAHQFATEIFMATDTYVDFASTPDDVTIMIMDAEDEAAARKRCEDHHLQPVEAAKSSFTPEDHSIYAAITEVTRNICGTLFRARSHLQAVYYSDIHEEETRGIKLYRAAETGQRIVQGLVRDLQWTRWEGCSACAVDEICFLPMFPFGSVADHAEGPRCLDETGLDLGFNLTDNYWGVDVRNGLKDMTEPF